MRGTRIRCAWKTGLILWFSSSSFSTSPTRRTSWAFMGFQYGGMLWNRVRICAGPTMSTPHL
jgi:hypothetical protein